MSVIRNDLVMIGVNITDMCDWDTIFRDEDRTDRIMSPNEHGCFVADQPMFGDLYVAGVRLGGSDPYSLENEIQYVEEDLTDLSQLSIIVSNYCKDEFGLENLQPKLISFTQWI